MVAPRAYTVGSRLSIAPIARILDHYEQYQIKTFRKPLVAFGINLACNVTLPPSFIQF
jgi:hypothetical protein